MPKSPSFVFSDSQHPEDQSKPKSPKTESPKEDFKDSEPSIQTGTKENLGDALTKENEYPQDEKGQHPEDQSKP